MLKILAFCIFSAMSQLYQIALSQVHNIGPVYAKTLLSYVGDAETIFKTPIAKLCKVPGVSEKRLKAEAFTAALTRAEKELPFIEKNGVDVLFYTDACYPKRLKNCDDSPILLYSKGNADLNMQRVVSIVGTRNSTDYGKQICEQLMADLQRYNVLVVSGLALGIDVLAHKECLRHNIPTVGVLGHGLDKFYPAPNRATAEKMQQNGSILTEYLSGTIANREHFPARNRIVAGMADATIVVEAGIKGGALITAEIANSYNRDVFAFPGRIGDTYSEGCNFLIRHNKASLLSCIEDFAFSMGWEENAAAKPVEQLSLFADLTDTERVVFDAIRANQSPLAIDELAIRTRMPMSTLAMDLLNMEMQGVIRSLPGKMYRIV